MRTQSQFRTSSGDPQQGFVLIVALILLLVLTLLGLAAAQSTSLEQKMAGNARDQDMAFQASEAGLSAARGCVLSATPACVAFNAVTTGGNGSYLFDVTNPTLWTQANFWTTAGNTLGYTAITGTSLPSPVAAQPQFIIEELPPVAAPGMNLGQSQFGGGTPSVSRYRVTSLGTGGSSTTTTMLQSVITQ
ncbi:MAG: pilus assembly PilX family protein [Gammaproteobacteria bacterium]